MTYYKVLNGLESCYGGHATWEPGRWMPWVRELVPCKSGYCVCDGEYMLLRWLVSDIWIAEVKGGAVNIGDKVFAHQVRIVEKTAWNTDRAARFVRDCVDRIDDSMGSWYGSHVHNRGCSTACAVAYAAHSIAHATADYATDYATERRWQAERLGQYLRGEL